MDPDARRRLGPPAGHERDDQRDATTTSSARPVSTARKSAQPTRVRNETLSAVGRQVTRAHRPAPGLAGECLSTTCRGVVLETQSSGSQDEAVGQGRHRHRLHVVGQDEIAPAQGRLGPRELEQGEAPARRGAQRHPRVHPRGLGERHDVALERLADEHVLERAPAWPAARPGHDGRDGGRRRSGARAGAAGSPARRPRPG